MCEKEGGGGTASEEEVERKRAGEIGNKARCSLFQRRGFVSVVRVARYSQVKLQLASSWLFYASYSVLGCSFSSFRHRDFTLDLSVSRIFCSCSISIHGFSFYLSLYVPLRCEIFSLYSTLLGICFCLSISPSLSLLCSVFLFISFCFYPFLSFFLLLSLSLFVSPSLFFCLFCITFLYFSLSFSLSVTLFYFFCCLYLNHSICISLSRILFP